MKHSILFLLFSMSFLCFSQTEKAPKTIHVYVALCDNVNQGIVPVSSKLGNGQDPKNNLYWGALYGVKTHFKKSKDWTLVKTITSANNHILERILFKHNSSETYLLADAYDGKFIKNTTIDFLEASAGHRKETITYKDKSLTFGGGANMMAYVWHDGLMEFDVEGNFESKNNTKRDVIILACISKNYFKPYILKTKANPLVWTTGLMAPEAYTLKWAIDGWIKEETPNQIRERAAKAYHYYQKCGLNAAKRLLVTGLK